MLGATRRATRLSNSLSSTVGRSLSATPPPSTMAAVTFNPLVLSAKASVRGAAVRRGSPRYGDGGTAQCAQALGILVEILSRKGADDAEKQQAAELCDTLAALDAIRVAYWNWRKTQVLDPLY